jgi:hypothetical protein
MVIKCSLRKKGKNQVKKNIEFAWLDEEQGIIIADSSAITTS